jgi:hypothetical protein
VDHGSLYIIPPVKAEACLSKETMLGVVGKAKHRAKQLARGARQDIER